MASQRMESIKQRRAARQQWVRDKLRTAGNTVLDAAAFIDINPRTWREWVAAGIFPLLKKELILEALDSNEDEVRRHFTWRPA